MDMDGGARTHGCVKLKGLFSHNDAWCLIEVFSAITTIGMMAQQ